MDTTIVESIAEVQTELYEARTTKVDEEIIVNAFLDFIIKLQNHFNTYAGKLSSICDKIYENIEHIEDPNSLIKSAKDLLVEGRKFTAYFKKNQKIYSGTKTSLLSFERELDNLKEIVHDIDLKYNKIPASVKLNSLFNKM